MKIKPKRFRTPPKRRCHVIVSPETMTRLNKLKALSGYSFGELVAMLVAKATVSKR